MVEAQVREGNVQAYVEMATRARVPEDVCVKTSRYVVHVIYFNVDVEYAFA